MIHTGMYNKLVSFYKLASGVNDFGVRETQVEVKLFDAYVYMSNLRNTEFWEANRVNDKSKLRIRVRYTPKISEVNTKDCYVVIDGKYWNILSIENVLNRNKEYLMYLEYKKDGSKI